MLLFIHFLEEDEVRSKTVTEKEKKEMEKEMKNKKEIEETEKNKSVNTVIRKESKLLIEQ